MPFIDVMHDYFRGERVEALGFILPLGLMLAVGGLVVLKGDRSAFAWGACVPAILAGAILIATGLGVGLRTPAQVADVSQRYQAAPAAMVKDELPRMVKVNANFRTMFLSSGVAIVLGLGLVYGLRSEWAAGLGTMLILAGALVLVIDGFASRRALPYTSALEQIAQVPAAQP